MDEDLPVIMKLRMWCIRVSSIITENFYAERIKRFVNHYKICTEKEVIMLCWQM